MNGLRLAAIRLAALSENDRRWALAQLSVEQRGRLVRPLRDALKMGASKLKSIVEEITAQPRSSAVSSEATLFADIEPAALESLLSRLPQPVVGLLAQRYGDSWGRQYVGGLETHVQKSLMLSVASARARVSTHFIEQLERHAVRAAGLVPDAHDGRSFEAVMSSAPAVGVVGHSAQG